MCVYLIHLEKPLKHARHYIGFAHDGNLQKRIAHHRSGSGARFMAVVTQAGIKWEVVRTWPQADKTFERHLKNQKKPAAFCPICNPQTAINNMKGDSLL